jgi:glycosyltransferase involved in cell wall biosynthesis
MQKPKVVVVMPAYNAQDTIEKTWREVVAHDVVDLVIVVDDASKDDTMKRAQGLDKVIAHRHPANLGYGGNQKTCYRLALDAGADIVIMVHPDYQYTPKLIPAMAGMIASGLYSCVLASRILGGGALEGGMPWWRYVSNRFLTLAGNILLGTKVFDNQILAETVWLGFRIGEVSCPTSYAPDASSISFIRSVKYGFGCLNTAAQFRLAAWGLLRSPRFPADQRLAYRT